MFRVADEASREKVDSMRNVEELDHLRAAFGLGPPPDLLRLGLYNAEFAFSAPEITEAVRHAFLELQATVAPNRGLMSDPEDEWFLDRYDVSFDAAGHLHSIDDQPATYSYDHSPSHGSLMARYYVHGEPARANDLPDVVTIHLPAGEVYSLNWSVPLRPDDAPINIHQNGATGYSFGWGWGRSDGPTGISRYDRGWGVPSETPLPRWVFPAPAVYDIAYMAADPLTDADARLLVQQLDSVEPDRDERALLARTLLRWQPALSEGTREWLSTLI